MREEEGKLSKEIAGKKGKAGRGGGGNEKEQGRRGSGLRGQAIAAQGTHHVRDGGRGGGTWYHRMFRDLGKSL